MTRLEKYLLATASEIIEAETTLSRYFIIGNIKVRVSDHFSKNSNADLQIVIPYNGGTKYMVTIKNNLKFLVWNANQIKDFIPMLQIIKGIQESEIGNNKPTAVQKLQLAINGNDDKTTSLKFNGIVNTTLKEKNLSNAERKIFRKPKETWINQEITVLPHMLKKDLKINHGYINEDVQIFLSCTSITYHEILNIYKIITVDNNSMPSIKLLQEAYNLIKNQ